MESVKANSFPELGGADIRPRLFHGRGDYFRARFSVHRLLFGRPMRYYVGVNPAAFESGVAEGAARAIVAHELCHILYFERAGRLELLMLMRLLSKNFTARFERLTDLEAIVRGYGEGLSEYREWLYRNVPPEKLAEKRRNYFSPAEIAAVQALTARRPELCTRWRANIPLTLEEITASTAPRAGHVPSG
ncbi:MAG TPA: hypothetical protein VN282_11660 [Pyrinomonadaceae bacterium]|nr:hypothetical protein [Pyrinomonadaceae bacterium]